MTPNEKKLGKIISIALNALEVYADAGFYHACSFAFDRPTGGFDKDFSKDPTMQYARKMPGKEARKTLDRCYKMLRTLDI
jgi:hypothetical protein